MKNAVPRLNENVNILKLIIKISLKLVRWILMSYTIGSNY